MWCVEDVLILNTEIFDLKNLENSVHFLKLFDKEYNLKISASNAKTMAFHGNYPNRIRIVVEDLTLQ